MSKDNLTSNPSLEFAIRAIRDKVTKPLHVEIERLQQRVKDLEEEVRRETESRFSRERAADEPSEVRHGPCPCCGTEWTPNVAPIARVEIIGGEVSQTEIYAPGLPDGAHDLFPVPLERASQPPSGVLVPDAIHVAIEELEAVEREIGVQSKALPMLIKLLPQTKEPVRVGTLGHVGADKSNLGAALHAIERASAETDGGRS